MFYLVVIGAYCLFIVLIVWFLKRLGVGKIGKCFIILLLLVAPFWEQLWSKWLMFNFARHNRPLQEITRTVEKPGSVLWIDNVWLGFDDKARACMVERYLDGVHLQTLGLNDSEGNLYVYHAIPEDFAESAKMLPAIETARTEYEKAFKKSGYITKNIVPLQTKYFNLRNHYIARRKQEIVPIIMRSEIFSLDKSPTSFAYRVEFQKIQLSQEQKKYIWCDEITIRENKNRVNIAYSKRCLGYNDSITNPIGNPFYGSLRLGDERAYEFDNRVLFQYDRESGGECRSSIFGGIYKKLLED